MGEDAVKRVLIGYRYIYAFDYHTPLMYLPMQRTCLEMEPPVTKERITAIIESWYPGEDGVVRDLEWREEARRDESK